MLFIYSSIHPHTSRKAHTDTRRCFFSTRLLASLISLLLCSGLQADSSSSAEAGTSVIFSGLSHDPLGVATFVSGTGELKVQSLTSNVSDGVLIDTVASTLLESTITLDISSWVPGAGLIFEMRDDTPSGLGRISLEKSGGSLEVTPNFTDIGSSTYELIAFQNEQPVYHQIGLSGLLGTIELEGTEIIVNHYSVGAFGIQGLDPITGLTLDLGPVISAEEILVKAVSPSVVDEDIASVRILGQSVPEITLEGHRIKNGKLLYQGLGQTQLTPSPTALGLSNFAVGIEDVVDTELGTAASWLTKLDGLDNASWPMGALVNLETRGNLNGTPNLPVVEATLEDVGTETAVSFMFPGSASYTVEVQLAGDKKDLLNLSSGEAARFLADGSSETNPFVQTSLASPTELSMNLAFTSPVDITLTGGSTVSGDSILAYTGPSLQGGLPVSSISSLDIRGGGGLPQLTLETPSAGLIQTPNLTLPTGVTVNLSACQDNSNQVHVCATFSNPGNNFVSVNGSLVGIPGLLSPPQNSPFPFVLHANDNCKVGFTGKVSKPEGIQEFKVQVVDPINGMHESRIQSSITKGLPDWADCTGPSSIRECGNDPEDLIFYAGHEGGGFGEWSSKVP